MRNLDLSRKIVFVLVFGLARLSFAASSSEPTIDVNSVAILYNSSDTESKDLAEAYAKARSIPINHLVGLPLPDTEEITRQQYNNTLAEPLRAEFDKRQWWNRGKSADGIIVASSNKIRVLVSMKGVPLKIAREVANAAPAKSGSAAPDQNAATPAVENPLLLANEAAVDSELALFSVEPLPLNGPSNNPYYKSDKPFADSNFPFMMLVGRIDAANYQTCHRMIRDAQQAEQTGLWGRAYIDIANKYPEGDMWLRMAGAKTEAVGFPVMYNLADEVFTKYFPFTDTAIYYGWYEPHVNGPFINPDFHFRTGAIAVHLHSFSADTLRHERLNWCAPLLAKGAAATVGNVYEPYLTMTHHLDILQERLLAGGTLIESAYAAIPVLSWQNVVIGDPLYRPFRRLDGSGEKKEEDRWYRALRVMRLLYENQDSKRQAEMEKVGRSKQNPLMLEALGLEYANRKLPAQAALHFRDAKLLYRNAMDRLRVDLCLIDLDRNAQQIDLAIKGLRDAQAVYSNLPEAESVRSLLSILDPPAPPPARLPDPPKR